VRIKIIHEEVKIAELYPRVQREDMLIGEVNVVRIERMMDGSREEADRKRSENFPY